MGGILQVVGSILWGYEAKSGLMGCLEWHSASGRFDCLRLRSTVVGCWVIGGMLQVVGSNMGYEAKGGWMICLEWHSASCGFDLWGYEAKSGLIVDLEWLSSIFYALHSIQCFRNHCMYSVIDFQ